MSVPKWCMCLYDPGDTITEPINLGGQQRVIPEGHRAVTLMASTELVDQIATALVIMLRSIADIGPIGYDPENLTDGDRSLMAAAGQPVNAEGERHGG